MSTFLERLLPAIEQEATNIRHGNRVGLCFAVSSADISAAERVRCEELAPAMVTSCPETAVWHRIFREYRVIGALRWYRWALRTCQLVDRIQKDGINVASLQQ